MFGALNFPGVGHLIAAMAVATASVGWAGSKQPLVERLSGLNVMRFQPGVNKVVDFAHDGRGAQVIEGWRDNGNAHGYALYMVLLPSKPGGTDWNVVGVDEPLAFEDTIADAPHTGEDVVKSVVFAKGLVDGRPSTILLTATREWEESIPNPARTEIQAYALRHNVGDIGQTIDFFEPVGSYLTILRYCHADAALKAELKIPLPSNYAGGNSKTGC